jgi:hypothetical protein
MLTLEKRCVPCLSLRITSLVVSGALTTQTIFGGAGLTLMLMKFAPLSAATALATRVLPQPGGPYSSTPDAADRPMAANASGWAMGWLMEKDSSSRT